MNHNWEIKKLQDICLCIADIDHNMPKSVKTGIPFISAKDITDKNEINFSNTKYISNEDYKRLSRKINPENGDIIYTRIGTIGKAAIVKDKIQFIPSYSCCTIRPNKNIINTKFLLYFLCSEVALNQAKYRVNSSGVPDLGMKAIRDFRVHLPSLSVQKCIVEKLDKSFAAIVKAKENAEKNLQNAHELFESYLKIIFSNEKYKFIEYNFEDIIKENQIGLIRNTKEQNPNFKYRYLKMDSIDSENFLIDNKFVYVNATKEEVEKYKLDFGDFLFNTRNSYELVGKTCVFNIKDNITTLFNNNIMRIKFKKDISPEYINYTFCTPFMKQRIEKLKSGTTSVVGIYYNGLRNLCVPITSFINQQKIVNQLDSISNKTKKLITNYNLKISCLEELKQSILQKAFNGELND